MDNPNLIIVECPRCRLRISFKAVPGYGNRNITCPRCRHNDVAANFVSVVNNTLPVRAGDTDEDTTTTIVRPPRVRLVCLDTNEAFVLRSGENRVGRKANKNECEIAFTDPDSFMSRHHATLTVSSEPNKAVEIQLKDEDTLNGTFIDNARIPRNAIVRLEIGKRFRMGGLTFVCETV